jgi:hypothetical protein
MKKGIRIKEKVVYVLYALINKQDEISIPSISITESECIEYCERRTGMKFAALAEVGYSIEKLLISFEKIK